MILHKLSPSQIDFKKINSSCFVDEGCLLIKQMPLDSQEQLFCIHGLQANVGIAIEIRIGERKFVLAYHCQDTMMTQENIKKEVKFIINSIRNELGFLNNKIHLFTLKDHQIILQNILLIGGEKRGRNNEGSEEFTKALLEYFQSQFKEDYPNIKIGKMGIIDNKILQTKSDFQTMNLYLEANNNEILACYNVDFLMDQMHETIVKHLIKLNEIQHKDFLKIYHYYQEIKKMNNEELKANYTHQFLTLLMNGEVFSDKIIEEDIDYIEEEINEVKENKENLNFTCQLLRKEYKNNKPVLEFLENKISSLETNHNFGCN